MQLSVAVFVNILSSKGANQLQVLYIRTLRNIQGTFFYWSCGRQMYSQHFFSGNLQKFSDNIWKTCSGKLWGSIYSRYTADKDHTNILQTVFPIFFLCILCLIQRIPKGGGWMKTYIMTRMLVRPVNLVIWKSGETRFFCLKNQEVLA